MADKFNLTAEDILSEPITGDRVQDIAAEKKYTAEQAKPPAVNQSKPWEQQGFMADPDLMDLQDFSVALGSQEPEAQYTQPSTVTIPDVQQTYRVIPELEDIQSQSEQLDKGAISTSEELSNMENAELQMLAEDKEKAYSLQKYENKVLEAEKAKNESILQAKKDLNEYNQKIKEFKLDPNRLMNAKSMNKVWSALAVGLAFGISGQAGIAMMGSIDKMVENDIAQQEAELTKLKEGRNYAENAVTTAYKTFGDDLSSMALVKSTVYNNLAERLELESVKDGSKNNLKTSLLINELRKKAVDNQLVYAEKKAVTVNQKNIVLDTSEANKEKWAAEDRLRVEITQTNPEFTKWRGMTTSADSILSYDPKSIIGNSSAQLYMLYAYFKNLDDLTGVREGEIELVNKSRSLQDWATHKITTIKTLGKKAKLLTLKEMKDMQDITVKNMSSTYLTRILPLEKQFTETAKARRLNLKSTLFFPYKSLEYIRRGTQQSKKGN